MITGLLGSLAAIFTFWGWIWFLWDHKATAPGWLLLGAALCFAVIGIAQILGFK